jgi:LacI family transcriptional regulator
MGKKFRNKDLAARLGVSGTLVSLVLNNKADQHGIKKDTQEKVLTLARQMGYFEAFDESFATAPVDQKPGIVGLIVPSMKDPFVMQIAPMLQKAFYNIGLGFTVVTCDPDDQRYERLMGAFKKFFSGMILLGPTADDNTLRNLKNADYPFMLLEKQLKSLRHNIVSTDIAAGAQMVAKHILKLGYKNIVIVTDVSHYRADMYPTRVLADSLVNTGSVSKPVILETDILNGEAETELSRLDQFLRPPYRADAFVLVQAGLTYPVMGFLKKKKLRVPGDIAILSMEEAFGLDVIYSPVTSLRKPLETISSKVVNIVWSEIRNNGKGKFKRQLFLQPELIIRTSSGNL